MASPNLDQNKWYHLYVTSGPGQGLIGNNAGTGEKAGIWFNPTNLTSPKFRWQIFPFNSSAVVLRCLDAGENMYLSTLYSADEEVAGKTRPYLARGDIVDNSAFWTIEPWGDGTWYMWNADNGTDYHLMKKGSGLLAMSGDIAPPQAGQRWTFAEIDEINDEKYSSVILRGAMTSTRSSASSSFMSSTVSSSTITSSTSSPSSTPLSDDGSNSGLPTSTKAAIGASIGGVGILLLIIVPLFFLRRRKQQLREHGIPLEHSPVPGVYEQSRAEQEKFEKPELHHDDAPKHEASGKMIIEAAVEERPVELPGDMRQI